MPFCTKCGTENPEGNKFCSKCGGAMGGPVMQNTAPAQQPHGESRGQHSKHRTILQYVMIAAAIYGVSAVLLIFVQNWVGFFIAVAMAAVLYFAMQKTRQFEYETVKMICIGSGAAAVVFVLLSLGGRDVVAAFVHAAAAGLLFYTYTLIQKG